MQGELRLTVREERCLEGGFDAVGVTAANLVGLTFEAVGVGAVLDERAFGGLARPGGFVGGLAGFLELAGEGLAGGASLFVTDVGGLLGAFECGAGRRGGVGQEGEFGGEGGELAGLGGEPRTQSVGRAVAVEHGRERLSGGGDLGVEALRASQEVAEFSKGVHAVLGEAGAEGGFILLERVFELAGFGRTGTHPQPSPAGEFEHEVADGAHGVGPAGGQVDGSGVGGVGLDADIVVGVGSEFDGQAEGVELRAALPDGVFLFLEGLHADEGDGGKFGTGADERVDLRGLPFDAFESARESLDAFP